MSSRLLDWLWYPGLSPVLVSIAFHTSVFSINSANFSLHLPLNFICVSLQLMYLHPLVDPSLTLGTGSGTRCCGPRGGAGVRMKQTSRFRFLPWPGFEPRTLQ